ncbi:substrate-binding domain-containing protein [Pseudoclavibacter sp. CFCC 13611]|uniref:substrate-binding domain-containing protein n=1 Tax=Pseudoclavibacter sp. CFCC 13611 TaxID=2615178 RepID=UPI001788522B|nr:substrate-binding domain-containing protein [Pseudoclavibacter sp. CFCC 13611]
MLSPLLSRHPRARGRAGGRLRRVPRAVVTGAFALTLSVAASGCTTPTVPQTTTGPLEVRIAAGLSLPDGVAERFEQQTGMSLSVDDSHSADDLAAHLHDGDADLVLGVSAANSSGIDGDAGLVSYVSPRAGDGAADFALDRSDRLTAVSYDLVCALVDGSAVAASGRPAPTSLHDVVAQSDRLVMPDPASDSSGLVALAAVDRQSSGTDQLTDSLRQLGQAQIEPTEAQALQASAMGGGDRPVVFASAMRAVDIFPQGNIDAVTSTCTPRVRYAAIVAGSAHVNESRKLVDLLLDDGVQSDIARSWSALPVQRNASVPQQYQRFVDGYAATASGADLAVLQQQLPALLDAWQQQTPAVRPR